MSLTFWLAFFVFTNLATPKVSAISYDCIQLRHDSKQGETKEEERIHQLEQKCLAMGCNMNQTQPQVQNLKNKSPPNIAVTQVTQSNTMITSLHK